MNRKTFFTIAAIIILIIGVYFEAKLNASVKDFCKADFDFECYTYAVVSCGDGEFFDEIQIYGECMGTTCIGEFAIVCDGGSSGGHWIYISCWDPWCSDCQDN